MVIFSRVVNKTNHVSDLCMTTFEEDRDKELAQAECRKCHKPLTDPIRLKCGHIFDKDCLQHHLDHGGKVCKGKNRHKEYKARHQIEDNIKCHIAAVLPSRGNQGVTFEVSVLATMEKVRELIQAEFKKNGESVPEIRSMYVKAVCPFLPGKTLADYHVFPGDRTSVLLFE